MSLKYFVRVDLKKKSDQVKASAELDYSILPKTGVDQPFIKIRPFITTHHKFEPIGPITGGLSEEFQKKDADRALNVDLMNRTVYDSIDHSPYWEGECYLDETKLISVPESENDKRPGAYAAYGYSRYQNGSPNFGKMKWYESLKPYY